MPNRAQATTAVVRLLLLQLLFAAGAASATVVRFETVLGDFDVRLFDTATPASVVNFLNYVSDGDYDDSFIHRAPPNFVIQGGGFRWLEGTETVDSVPTDPAVMNEPGLTNRRGTLSYAKQGGNPNSATSGWFVNVSDDNADTVPGAQLDTQNGGFTAFGRVIGDGMQVVDAIADLSIVNAGGAFATLPVLDSFALPGVDREDLVFVNTISVVEFADGDYDFDGNVDEADYNVWRAQYGASLRVVDHAIGSPETIMEADGNGDGVVDALDYAVRRDSFLASAAVGVPEPGAWLLATLTAVWRPRSRRA